jgi:hypothetical protein
VPWFIPELWLMDRYDVQLAAPYLEELTSDLAVLPHKIDRAND